MTKFYINFATLRMINSLIENMNSRFKIGVIVSIAFLCVGNSIDAQNTNQDWDFSTQLNKANDNFQNRNYADAWNDYSLLIKQYQSVTIDKYLNDNQSNEVSDLYFNRALCVYYLMNNDVDVLFKEYITLFPNSSRNTQAVFYMANWYIQKADYNNALQTYQQIDPETLSQTEQLEYYYKEGYCYFLNKNYASAKTCFKKVKDTDSKYASPSKYYYGHILYEQGKYKEALTEFETLQRDKYFKNVVPYYICQIYYFDGNYDKIIEMAPTLSSKAINSKRATELNRMLGDAYYKKGEYEQALPYIKQSIEKSSSINRDDNYLMGYCLVQTQKYQEAIPYLQKSANDNDAMAQNSLYYLGYCYTVSGDTTLSKNAYKGASEMTFDKTIQEDAMFNYSKLCVNDPGPYNEAIKNFTSYIKKYPKSKKKNEAQEYLVQLYERTRNYKDALELMDNMSNRSKQMDKIYQKIALNRGIELYNNGETNDAIKAYEKSLKYPLDNTLTASAYYLEAEAYYKNGSYNKSVSYLKKFFAMPFYKTSSYNSSADYLMGYNLFKQKRYAMAKDYFAKIVNDQAEAFKQNIILDSRLRLADCEYMSRNYNKAIENYNSVIAANANGVDYAYYQKAMALGAVSNQQAKSETLKTAIDKYPSSPYVSSMTYELGNTYLALDNNQKALETYQYLLKNYPASTNVKESLGKIGMIQYQMGKYADALTTLDKVVKQYPNTNESKAALTTIKNIYIDKGQPNEYLDYVKNIPNVNVSNKEKENMLYQTAENQYMDEQYKKAIPSFERYLQEFPSGANSLKSQYYLADCLLRTGDTASAVKYYAKISSLPVNQYTEKSLQNAAAYYQDKDDAQTIILYTKLDSITSSATTKAKAKEALMNAYYNQKEYSEAIAYANKVTEQNADNQELKDKASYILAKSYLAIEDTTSAITELVKLKKSDNGAFNGEAMYILAIIDYNRGNLVSSERTIKTFAKNPTDEYFLAKSFILWADIFAKRGNDFQAKQTLKSIIDNYDNEEVVKEAQDKLSALENKGQKEKQENELKEQEQQNAVDEIIIP